MQNRILGFHHKVYRKQRAKKQFTGSALWYTGKLFHIACIKAKALHKY